MKKKDIKRISKKIFEQITTNYSIYDKPVKENNSEKELVGEYDEMISNRFKKLVNNLIKYPDNIRLSYNDHSISLEVSDIKSLKKDTTKSMSYNNSNMVKSNDNDNISIYIYNHPVDGKFSITQGYSKSTKYSDINMYNDLIETIKDKVKEINSDNFNNIWEDISRESGILRDSNLDDILS